MEYQTSITCKELVMEQIERRVKMSITKLCAELIEDDLIAAC